MEGKRTGSIYTPQQQRTGELIVTVTLFSFQMVSLLKLATVTEEGVRFLSPHDGSPMYHISLGVSALIEANH